MIEVEATNVPTDFGFRLQVIVTVLVAAVAVWAGFQSGDWTGILLVVPLAVLIPITARLPAERPRRRGSPETKEREKPRY
jgi:hypothetical protein